MSRIGKVCNLAVNGSQVRFHSLNQCLFFLFKLPSGVKAVASSSQTVLGALVGNKAEYRHGVVDTRTEVTFAEGQQAAGELGLAYFEASAVR